MVNFVSPVAPTRLVNPPRGTRELGETTETYNDRENFNRNENSAIQ